MQNETDKFFLSETFMAFIENEVKRESIVVRDTPDKFSKFKKL